MCRRPTAAITGMRCTESTWTPVSSCPTSASTAIISSTTVVPAVVCVVEYAVVLQWRPDPDLPERQAQDRTVDRQWLAVLRQVQSCARSRRSNSMAADRTAVAGGEQLLGHRHR